MITSDPYILMRESLHLLLSNKEKCKSILTKPDKTDGDIMEFLISLHLVLELGLNAFFRHIIMTQLQKGIEQTKVASNLDKISFIDKVILFIYMPSFNFDGEGDIDRADTYHEAIGKLRNFAGVRNKLLHGHMVAQFRYSDTNIVETETALLLNEDTLRQQITDFKFIMNAIAFYFDHLDSSFTQVGKLDLKAQFLDTGFL